jgi:hypothetical protein
MDFGYEEYLKKKTLREKQKESEVPTGIKVTRRRRLEREAAETENKALAHLDYEHQKYLRMLSEAVCVAVRPLGIVDAR